MTEQRIEGKDLTGAVYYTDRTIETEVERWTALVSKAPTEQARELATRAINLAAQRCKDAGESWTCFERRMREAGRELVASGVVAK